MKKYIYLLLAAVGVLFASACHKITTEDQSWVTYYPEIILEGDNPLVLSLGETFTEPGYSATLFGNDVTSEVVVSSEVNTATFGVYSIEYATVNADGYPWSVVRDVYVLNPGHIDNLYKVKCEVGTTKYEFTLPVTKVSGDTYHIGDIMGGFYSLGKYPGYEAYGYDFWGEADFTINPDNSITLGTVGDWFFLTSYDYTTFVGTYDPVKGTLSWTIEGSFKVTLTPYSI